MTQRTSSPDKPGSRPAQAVRPHQGEQPTAAAPEYRLPLYPVGRLEVPRVADTKWGSVKVERGHLTARHRDLLDAILACAVRTVADASWGVHVIFDVADVRRMLGVTSDWSTIRKMLLDMETTAISWKRPGEEWPDSFPILSFVGEANSDAERPSHQFKGKLKRITLSPDYVRCAVHEVRLYLNLELTRQVLALTHQVSRSVARWCLSHSSAQRHELSQVLEAVGAIQPGEPISGRLARRGARKYVEQLAYDSQALAELGIVLDGGQVVYTRNKGVFVSVLGAVEPKTAVNPD